ncbi:hypothetical protein ACETU7_32440 [Rhodococcus sp. 3Y1]
MFDLFLDYLSKIVDFGSVDLVGTFVKYLNALSSSPRHRKNGIGHAANLFNRNDHVGIEHAWSHFHWKQDHQGSSTKAVITPATASYCSVVEDSIVAEQSGEPAQPALA